MLPPGIEPKTVGQAFSLQRVFNPLGLPATNGCVPIKYRLEKQRLAIRLSAPRRATRTPFIAVAFSLIYRNVPIE
jgi:hypothetical protein